MHGLRAALERLDDVGLEQEILSTIRELFPLHRSITGPGVRASLRMLQRIAPIEMHEVATGTRVLDWAVPREWSFRSAKLIGPDGTVVVDADRLDLHVLGYSVPFHGLVSREELEMHLHSVPDQPDVVPYRTSYYRDDWGFCLSETQRRSLLPGTYEVVIDTTLAEGALTYGEALLTGASKSEVLVSTHICHPALANDNLSGMIVAALLARILAGVARRHTYRFVFVPGTIGSIAWLARNEQRTGDIAHGLVLACLGDMGGLTYKRSRRGNAPIDRVATHVLAHSDEPHEVRDFSPYGYDERQYCSPGFDLPVGALTRTPYGEYPEYHTSADDLDFVKPAQIVRAIRCCLEIFDVLERDTTYRNLSPKGEPQLGRRGLYGSVGGASQAAREQMAMLWVLNMSDGTRSLLDIAERSGFHFSELDRAARALEAAGLLQAA